VPLGAFAQIENRTMRLRGFVAAPDGSRMVSDQVHGDVDAPPERLGHQLAERLIAQGARDILAQLESAHE
jgi:hydroxymethylbilane synthase